ncbi:LPS export ABC transporter protein LptC [Elusimicrobium simillimum]|uniref:LPS export ABC transporter periplasmic protein LptC n=1 Tax=Elusimicrobium simillimum TaxID=3143438 RepID=UPI003C704598
MKKLILLLPLVFMLACSGNSGVDDGDEPGVQIVQNAVMYEAKGGRHSWILNADTVKFYEDREAADLVKPNLTFKDKDDAVSTIKGDTGQISMKEQSIVLRGNVQGKSVTENATLRTSVLYYNIETKKIWTDRTVHIKRNGVTVKAAGMKANGDFSEIELENQTTVIPENEKDI